MTNDGYVDAAGTVSTQLPPSLDAVDQALGSMVDELAHEKLRNKTLVIVGAKTPAVTPDASEMHMIFSNASEFKGGST